jgi:hypothetical protein
MTTSTTSFTGVNTPQAHDAIKDAPSMFGLKKELPAVPKKMVGIKHQVAAAVDKALLERCGSSLATWIEDLSDALDYDDEVRAGGQKSNKGFRVWNELERAFRHTVIDTVVKAMRRKEVGKAGLIASLPSLVQLHNSLNAVRTDQKDLMFGCEPLIPFWVCSTFVGRDDADAPIFEKAEIWDAEAFKEYVTTEKFVKDAIRWMVSDSLQNEIAPAFNMRSGTFSEAFESALVRNLENKNKRDIKEAKGKEWARIDFYQGGQVGKLKERMHIETVLASVGQLIKTFNNVVGNAMYNIAKALDEPVRAGMESASRDLDVLEHELTIVNDDGVLALVEDSTWRNLVLEIENMRSDIQNYVDAWKAILPEVYMKEIGTQYNGGYEFIEEGNYKKLPPVMMELDMYHDGDKLKIEADRRRAYAVEKNAELRKDKRAKAYPITF